MDPGTALAVVSLSYEVVQDLYEYYRKWKQCDSDILELRVKLLWLHRAFGAAQKTLQRPSLPRDGKQLILDAVSQCNDDINELKDILEKAKSQGSAATTLERLKAAGRKAKENINSCQDALNLALDLLCLDTIAQTFESLKDLDTKLLIAVGDVDTAIQRLQASTNGLVDSIKRQRNARIAQWINAPDQTASSNLQQAPGTNIWFFKGTIFEQWKNQPICTAPYWKRWVLPHANVVTFYCISNSGYQVNVNGILRSIIAGLNSTKALDDIVTKLFDRHSRSLPPTQPSIHELEDTAKHLLDKCKDPTYLMVDALDEIPRAEVWGVISLLSRLTYCVNENLHFLVTSRPGDFCITLNENDRWSVRTLPISHIQKDIHHYTRQEIQQNLDLCNLSEYIRSQIESRLSGTNNDMFRWAVLQLDAIKRLRIVLPSLVSRTLSNLPTDLKSTYERTLQELQSKDTDVLLPLLAEAALKILAYSFRPLSVTAFVDVLAVAVRERQDWQGVRDLRAPDLFKLLPGMIIIVPNGRLRKPTEKCIADEVYFAHFSVKEYVTGQAIFQSSVRRFAAEKSISHRFLALNYLTYVMFINTMKHPEDTWLLLRAAVDWKRHLLLITPDPHLVKDELIQEAARRACRMDDLYVLRLTELWLPPIKLKDFRISEETFLDKTLSIYLWNTAGAKFVFAKVAPRRNSDGSTDFERRVENLHMAMVVRNPFMAHFSRRDRVSDQILGPYNLSKESTRDSH